MDNMKDSMQFSNTKMLFGLTSDQHLLSLLMHIYFPRVTHLNILKTVESCIWIFHFYEGRCWRFFKDSMFH